MKNNIVNFDPLANDPHFNVWALCLNCQHRWIGTVHYQTSLFKLECPNCGATESFASIISEDYLAANRCDDESILERVSSGEFDDMNPHHDLDEEFVGRTLGRWISYILMAVVVLILVGLAALSPFLIFR